MAHFAENQVHEYLYEVGIESVIQENPIFDSLGDLSDVTDNSEETEEAEPTFELWRLIKHRALEMTCAPTFYQFLVESFGCFGLIDPAPYSPSLRRRVFRRH